MNWLEKEYLSFQKSGDPQWYWRCIPLYDWQQRSETEVRSDHTATCHGSELQQRLWRHFNCHAAFQVALVTLDGHWAALWLDGLHSELCGLYSRLHWDVLARGFMLVCVAASNLLGPGTVQQLITLRRIGNVGTSSETGYKNDWALLNITPQRYDI